MKIKIQPPKISFDLPNLSNIVGKINKSLIGFSQLLVNKALYIAFFILVLEVLGSIMGAIILNPMHYSTFTELRMWGLYTIAALVILRLTSHETSS